ncbi:hypothetical protein Glove_258g50 [Diversispora epigaea]|uniref:Uncharacterized protein n=1 Tax=Diversispora epigaea TaxID=1348612 RepID=A0A397I783_9GLOM|nr:hypothetical protein Glove_258g50 [Diversispora epigaea]
MINQNNTTYTCTIIKEGFYPLNNIIKYIFSHSGNNINCKIPDEYLIYTSWSKGTLRHMVKCKINYVDATPIFKISFGESFQTCLESAKSATNVKKNPNKKVRFSGVYVFGLNNQELERERKRKYQSCFLKPFNKLALATDPPTPDLLKRKPDPRTASLISLEMTNNCSIIWGGAFNTQKLSIIQWLCVGLGFSSIPKSSRFGCKKDKHQKGIAAVATMASTVGNSEPSDQENINVARDQPEMKK